MANTQTSPGRFKRMLRWFGRHKVTTVFTVLLLALCIWLFGSWVVWNVEVSSERRRYEATAQKLKDVQKGLAKVGITTAYVAECQNSNSGIVFGFDSIGCDVTLTANYSGLNMDNTLVVSRKAETLISKERLKPVKRPHNYDTDNIFPYDFKYEDFDCSLDMFFYDPANQSAVPVWVVGGETKQSAAQLGVYCGGQAKVDYFPVTKD